MDNKNKDKLNPKPQLYKDATERIVLIRCINPECFFHNGGFEYKLETGELTTSDNNSAYDLIIECPNGHGNKIWQMPNIKFDDVIIVRSVRNKKIE
jgi:hypothetical protein